jgi:hypothetical protein
MLQNLRRQSNNITAFKQNLVQESSQRRTETVKPGGMSKEDQGKLIKNYVRLVTELPTTDIADYNCSHFFILLVPGNLLSDNFE